MRPVMRRVALAGHRTAIWHLPELRWAGVILCNSASALQDAKMDELTVVYLGRPAPWVQTNTVTGVRVTVPPQGQIPEDIVREY